MQWQRQFLFLIRAQTREQIINKFKINAPERNLLLLLNFIMIQQPQRMEDLIGSVTEWYLFVAAFRG